MPTMMVFVGCLSVYPAVSTGTTQINFLDIFGILITLGAIILETVADIQLHKFREEESNQEKVNDVGLFSYSRHPNYFGEICFWWGLFIFGISADSTYWWTIIGPLSITLLFIFISIPIMEKHNAKKRSSYAEYMKKVSFLIPWKRKIKVKK
jgi:steroid 5-alpha reductase family enzyme